MATLTDTTNDRLQQSTGTYGAREALSGVSIAVLRALCDLNHLETTGSRDALTARLIAEVYPR